MLYRRTRNKRAEKLNYVTRDWFSLDSFIRSNSKGSIEGDPPRH